MGNKLEATRAAIAAGFTGVSDPSSTLSAISKGAKDIAAWKKNLDAQKLKLKTDTAKIARDLEKETYENLPSNATYQQSILKGLADYKEQLYINTALVQKGILKPEDNLIMQENAKESFSIMSKLVKDNEKDYAQNQRELSGYYQTNDKGEQVFVKPTAGAGQLALSEQYNRLNDSSLYAITFGNDGMGRINYYKTKIDKPSNTRILDLDKNGNPQIDPNVPSQSVLSLKGGRNQKMARIYINDEVERLTGKNTAFDRSFQTFVETDKTTGKFIGTLEDNLKNKEGIVGIINNAVSAVNVNPANILSILSDNGPGEQQSKPLNELDYGLLSDKEKNERLEYSYIDKKGQRQIGVKSKYIQLKTSSNQTIVPILSEEDRLAAERISYTAIYDSLGRKFTRGVVDPEIAIEARKAAATQQQEFTEKEKEKDRQLQRDLYASKNQDFVETYSGLDNIAIELDGTKITTAVDLIGNISNSTKKDEDDLAFVGRKIVDKALTLYPELKGLDVELKGKDKFWSADNDTLEIFVDGKLYDTIQKGKSDSENQQWLLKSLDKIFREQSNKNLQTIKEDAFGKPI